MKRSIIALFSIVFLFTGCVALQQDMAIMEDRVLALEVENRELKKSMQADLDTLGKSRQSSERSLRAQVAGMNANMESLQQEVRLLNGRIEEMEYLINHKVSGYEASGKKNTERLEEMGLSLAKMDQRLIQLEQYLNVESKNARPSGEVRPGSESPKPGQAEDSAKVLYEKARQAYDNGEMDKARQLFKKLIQSYPESNSADNAQFWIGESYYREKWYERAILEYQTVIEKYPKGNKVPAAMLKQGLALLKIKEKSSARLILQELVKKYPKASESKIAAKKLKEF
ncbi:MAG: tol-pal system protein YbgF [Desulfobacteraceae bacterium]